MKVYNYTNIPVYYRDDPIPLDIHPIHIERKNYGFWTHNGEQIKNDGLNDKLYIVPHWNDSIQYDYQLTKFPEVSLWIGVFLTFFSFFFLVRIIQKIKLS